jgi:hypothetical protein
MNILKVQFVNFWHDNSNNRWLLYFIKHIFKTEYEIIEVNNNNICDILICSVSGNIENIYKYKAKLKLFYYGENLDNCKYYKDINLLKNTFDLIVGFLPTDGNIIRFPLWFLYYPFYEMTNDNNNIIDYIKNEREKNKLIEKKYFASCIAKHNLNNIRSKICDEFAKYNKILYPSKFRKNCNIGKHQNDKINFLKNVKYNICPENSKYSNYHTEKIFQAFQSGTIPIYWGIGLPEIDIINPKSYVFVDIENYEKMCEQIKYSIDNYEEIFNENIFTNDAKNIIDKYYKDLEKSIKKYFINENI